MTLSYIDSVLKKKIVNTRSLRYTALSVGFVTIISNLFKIVPIVFMVETYSEFLPSKNASDLLVFYTITVLTLLIQQYSTNLRKENLSLVADTVEESVEIIIFDKWNKSICQKSILEIDKNWSDLRKTSIFLRSDFLATMLDSPFSVMYIFLLFYFHWNLACIALVVIFFQLIFVNISQKHKTAQSKSMKMRPFWNTYGYELKNYNILKIISCHYPSTWLHSRIVARSSQGQVSFALNILYILIPSMKYLFPISIFVTASLLVISDRASFGIMMASTLISARIMGPIDSLIRYFPQRRLEIEALSRTYKLISQFAPRSAGRGVRRSGNDNRLHEKKLTQDYILDPLCKDSIILSVKDLVVKTKNNNMKLHFPNFNLKRGECLIIRGKNGSGKTNLINTILGNIPAESGGVDFEGFQAADYISQYPGIIGYSPQQYRLLSGSPYENIFHFSESKRSSQIYQVCKLLGMDLYNDPVFHEKAKSIVYNQSLPASMIKLIGIAAAFSQSPQIVILDDPFSFLDADSKSRIFDLVNNFCNSGGAVIICVIPEENLPKFVSIIDI